MGTHGHRLTAPSKAPGPAVRDVRVPSSLRSGLHAVLMGARSAAGWLIVAASVFAGVGLTYALRETGAIALGPKVAGALPLQQLAGGDSQPLLRMAVAWMLAGAVAGIALTTLTRSRLVTRIIWAALLAFALLLIAGAAADAIAVTDAIGPHLLPQLSRIGTWVATAFFCAGVVLPTFAGWRQARDVR
jgi:hypothetical protein